MANETTYEAVVRCLNVGMPVQYLSEVTEKNHQTAHVKPRNSKYRVRAVTS